MYGVPGVCIFAGGVLYRASESELAAPLGLPAALRDLLDPGGVHLGLELLGEQRLEAEELRLPDALEDGGHVVQELVEVHLSGTYCAG